MKAVKRAGVGTITTKACAVGEACLQLVRIAYCPDVLDVNSGREMREVLAKCVEGTSKSFWRCVDDCHGRSVEVGLTRVQHIENVWEIYLANDGNMPYDFYKTYLQDDEVEDEA